MQNSGRLRYLRVSLLNNCNLNCFYCRPEKQPVCQTSSDNFEKFKRSIELLYKMGVRKVRFTGGEPTLYKRLPELISLTKKLNGSVQTALTSNGLLLNKTAKELGYAGLDSINISIDTLNPGKFKLITKRDKLNTVISGIKNSINYIRSVKLNCVLIKGINDDEVDTLIRFANQLGVNIRFIEYMPSQTNSVDKSKYISGDEIISLLPYPLIKEPSEPTSAARYYSSPELDIRVGFINPVSHPFCANCNRIRLASDGNLYGCLFSDDSINLFELLDNDFNTVVEKMRQLIDSKQYLGCAGAMQPAGNLPLFINMGG